MAKAQFNDTKWYPHTGVIITVRRLGQANILRFELLKPYNKDDIRSLKSET